VADATDLDSSSLASPPRSPRRAPGARSREGGPNPPRTRDIECTQATDVTEQRHQASVLRAPPHPRPCPRGGFHRSGMNPSKCMCEKSAERDAHMLGFGLIGTILLILLILWLLNVI